MMMFPLFLSAAAAAATAAPVAGGDAATRAAILATCHDNIDGQLEGDVARVARSLHPSVVMRAVDTSPGHAADALEIETRETLLESTRKGELKLPRAQWHRSCEILSIAGNAAVVKLETPAFISFDEYGKFDGTWKIVQSFWTYKPRPKPDRP